MLEMSLSVLNTRMNPTAKDIRKDFRNDSTDSIFALLIFVMRKSVESAKLRAQFTNHERQSQPWPQTGYWWNNLPHDTEIKSRICKNADNWSVCEPVNWLLENVKVESVSVCEAEGQLMSECLFESPPIEGERAVAVETLLLLKKRPHF
jgi:hypothetical protein